MEKNIQLHYFTGSVLTPPVRPVRLNGQTGATWPNPTTGQTGPLTDQTGRNKTEGCTLCLKYATRQIPDLRVSIHHFPPLCISADEFDAAEAEVNVRVSCNKNMWQQTLSN